MSKASWNGATEMRTYLLVSGDERAQTSLDYVRDALQESDLSLIELTIDDSKVPRSDQEGRLLAGQFKHTPEPLLRAWRTARNLQGATEPGDVVLMSDVGGLGGIFALIQSAAPTEERRQLWTIAADSAFLELRLVARAHRGLPMPLESEIDWEIVQYQFSDRVLATSALAAVELARIGVASELVGSSEGTVEPKRTEPITDVWVPGPVSRRGQTAEILRAATALNGVHITLSNKDAPDGIWTATTWESLRHSRDVLDDRIRRGDRPSTRPDVIIVGDPYWPPDRMTRGLLADGVPLIAPVTSVCSRIWPEAQVWEGSDDVASILRGGEPERPSTPSFETDPRTANPERAKRISVGIPVFRDTRFLNECIDSVLDQRLQPVEVIVIDDGSASTPVEQALESLTQRDSRIKVVRTDHRGVCVARNRALEEMTGDSFVFVDSDDVLEPTFLSKSANVLRTDESLWAVATWTRFFGSYEGVEAKPPFDARVGNRENPIISTAALVDMSVRDKGIRFEPDLAFLYCEDWHFWSQIVAAGGRMGLVPEPLAKHRVHEGSGGYLRTELAHAIGKTRATEPLTG